MRPEVLAKATELIEKARAALYKGGPRGSSMAYMFCGSYDPLEKKLRMDGEHGKTAEAYLKASADSGQLHAILIIADMHGTKATPEEFEKIKKTDSGTAHFQNILLGVLHTPTETYMRRLTFTDKEGRRLFSDAGWAETTECGGILSNPWNPKEMEAPADMAFVGKEKD